MKLITLSWAAAMCAVTAAFAQTTPSPVTPQTCSVTSVTTGGTAVTAFAGPANGFMLMNPATSAALYYSLTGSASTTASGGTFTLAAGQWFVFPGQLSASASLSVNAASGPQAFSCMRW